MAGTTSEPKFALLVLPESTPASIYGLYEVFLSDTACSEGRIGACERDCDETGEDRAHYGAQ